MPYPLKKLGEISNIITGNTPKTKFPEYYGGDIMWAGPGDFSDSKFIYNTNKSLTEKGVVEGRARLVKKRSVLLVAIGATIGKVGINKESITTNQQINSFECDKDFLNSEYLYYYFRKIKDYFLQESSQTTLPIINKTQCKDIEIPLPPLSIQNAIVQKLDTAFENIDASIELAQRNLKNIDELGKSVLNEVLLRGNYKEKKLSEITAFNTKGIVPLPKESYNYLGLENISSNTGKLIDFTPTDGEKIKSNKVVFEKGMVLYGKLRPYLNKVLIAEFDGVATTEILPIECSSKIYNLYLGYFLRTNYFVNIANSNISGARMPRVTTKFLKEEVLIPLPPLEKQKEIVEHLDKVFEKNAKMKELYESKLRDLQEMKQSLLREAFEGRLVSE